MSLCTSLYEGRIASLSVAMFLKSVPYPVALQQGQPVQFFLEMVMRLMNQLQMQMY